MGRGEVHQDFEGLLSRGGVCFVGSLERRGFREERRLLGLLVVYEAAGTRPQRKDRLLDAPLLVVYEAARRIGAMSPPRGEPRKKELFVWRSGRGERQK